MIARPKHQRLVLVILALLAFEWFECRASFDFDLSRVYRAVRILFRKLRGVFAGSFSEDDQVR